MTIDLNLMNTDVGLISYRDRLGALLTQRDIALREADRLPSPEMAEAQRAEATTYARTTAWQFVALEEARTEALRAYVERAFGPRPASAPTGGG